MSLRFILRRFLSSSSVHFRVLGVLASMLLAMEVLVVHSQAPGSPPEVLHAGKLKVALNKLTTLGSVLYVAAHPDDENTAFIAYCANEKLLRTAYLSITRGDGGQNLIGSEQSELLGMIRTQELLAARRIDGGEQLFTRALDFGFSKNPNETFAIWGKERILADVVWAVRKFRPDVIITRFPKTGEGGHGHHTASAILAEEAFFAAQDPKRFPEQLRYVQPWRAKRVLWNAWLPVLEARKADLAKLTAIDVGAYSPLLGKSCTELAAESRSQHKSQGFGSSGVRGESLNYFDFIAGDSIKPSLAQTPQQQGRAMHYDIFEGIDVSWNRVDSGRGAGAAIGRLLEQAQREFNLEQPEAILPLLLKARAAMTALLGTNVDDQWILHKRKELDEVVRSCAGIWIEALATASGNLSGIQQPVTPAQADAAYSVTPGASVKVAASLVNRSSARLSLVSVQFPFTTATVVNTELQRGKFVRTETIVDVPSSHPITQPYWLQKPMERGVFSLDDQRLVGLPENAPPLTVGLTVRFPVSPSLFEDITYTVPVIHRRTDRVLGEVYRPLEIVPPVSLILAEKSIIVAEPGAHSVSVVVRSNKNAARGIVRLMLPEGWKCEPSARSFALAAKGDEMQALFSITPPAKPLASASSSSSSSLRAEAILEDGSRSERGMMTLEYPHIPAQALFPEAAARLVYVDVKKTIKTIGYISSKSDDVAHYLRQIGFNVQELTDDDIEKGVLSRYDAIVTGVRAYNDNQRPRLRQQYRRLMDYVQQGGTMIVQYNTSNGLVTDSIGPYPFTISRDRVTEEDAAVKFLNDQHPLLNIPNRITQRDFEGWVQERGLYFANKWDARYQTLLACNDSGESEKQGGMLIAQYGKGAFIYSGYAWFRQLPAGVPGAYRLFVNMLHAAQTLSSSAKAR